MIHFKTLPQIKTAHQLFSTDKVVLLELICIDEIHHPEAALLFHNRPNVFTYKGKTFYLLIMKGSPENLVLNAKQGVPFPAPDGGCALLQWNLNLPKTISAGKLFDISRHQHSPDYKQNQFEIGMPFLLKHYRAELEMLGNQIAPVY